MKKKTPEELLLKLTEREIDVLRLFCQHKNYQEIAETFVLTEGTIRTHMFNIYTKLEFDDLDRDERVLKIHNDYCPLLQKQSDQQPAEPEIGRIDEAPDPDHTSLDREGVAEETPNIELISKKEKQVNDKTPENESISPDEEQFSDETPDPEPISPKEAKMVDEDEMAVMTYRSRRKTGGRKEMGTTKKRKSITIMIALILGALIMIGAWYTWQNIFKEMPIVQSILPKSISNTGAYEIGEWHQEGELWFRVYEVDIADPLNIYFEIWNKSPDDIYFTWTTQQNISLSDNTGGSYDITEAFRYKEENVNLPSGTRYDLGRVNYWPDPLYEPNVSELLFSIEYFSRFEKATWRIPVNK